MKPNVQIKFIGGREFRRIVWTRNQTSHFPEGARAVIVVWHVRQVMSPSWFKGSCVSRRVVR